MKTRKDGLGRVTDDRHAAARRGTPSARGARRMSVALGFTLIELLIVIAIIGILAALILPVTGAIKRNATLKKAQAELEQVATAIEAYKAKCGHYPPDNPAAPATSQLYFELLGTKLVSNGSEYETLDGSARIAVGAIPALFGTSGFVNCTRTASADDAPAAVNFVKQLRPGQYGEVAAGVRVLACSVRWPPDTLNPWRYVSSNPKNNPGAYDLWVDILLAGKTNRISNWSKRPQLVGLP
jgi:prepilin-type N-terminal cleavage/methylation domain-containing protein